MAPLVLNVASSLPIATYMPHRAYSVTIHWTLWFYISFYSFRPPTPVSTSAHSASTHLLWLWPVWFHPTYSGFGGHHVQSASQTPYCGFQTTPITTPKPLVLTSNTQTQLLIPAGSPEVLANFYPLSTGSLQLLCMPMFPGFPSLAAWALRSSLLSKYQGHTAFSGSETKV